MSQDDSPTPISSNNYRKLPPLPNSGVKPRGVLKNHTPKKITFSDSKEHKVTNTRHKEPSETDISNKKDKTNSGFSGFTFDKIDPFTPSKGIPEKPKTEEESKYMSPTQKIKKRLGIG